MSFLLNILCIDSSTEACSVAVRTNQLTQHHHFMLAPREHTQRILPTVEQVIKDAKLLLSDIDVIAYGQGPGSFTGVRIGISIAQGLAFGLDKKMVGVSTLQAMAQQALEESQVESVFSAIDARMGEVYFAHYINKNGLMVLQEKEIVIKPEDLIAQFDDNGTEIIGSALVGTAWKAYPVLTEYFSAAQQLEVIYPSSVYMLKQASALIEKGEAVDPELAMPVYLRDTVTWKKLPGRE